MPRYEIRNTSNNALTYVDAALPADLLLTQAAGTYRARVMSEEHAGDIVVPTLTAGSISNVSPTIGATLTVTGSNAPTGATFLWQRETSPGVWAAAGGTNNAATYNTTGQVVGTYRRQVSTAAQGPVSTTGVAVAASKSVTVAATDTLASGGSTTRTISNVNLGAEAADREFLVIMNASFNDYLSDTDWQVSVAGQNATRVLQNSTIISSVDRGVWVWRVSVPSGATGDVVLSRVSGTSTFGSVQTTVLRMTGTPTLGTPAYVTASNISTTAPTAYRLSPSLTVSAGSWVYATAWSFVNTTDINLTNSTEIVSASGGSGRWHVTGFNSGVSAGTRTVDADFVSTSTSFAFAYMLEIS